MNPDLESRLRNQARTHVAQMMQSETHIEAIRNGFISFNDIYFLGVVRAQTVLVLEDQRTNTQRIQGEHLVAQLYGIPKEAVVTRATGIYAKIEEYEAWTRGEGSAPEQDDSTLTFKLTDKAQGEIQNLREARGYNAIGPLIRDSLRLMQWYTDTIDTISDTEEKQRRIQHLERDYQVILFLHEAYRMGGKVTVDFGNSQQDLSSVFTHLGKED